MTKKAVFIIAPNDFSDQELLEPKKFLENRGVIVKVANKTRRKAQGKRGTEIEPDLALAEVEAKDFDAVVFIGGSGARVYFADEQALKIAKEFQKAGKIIGAICLAPSILANAGVLISKTVTSYPSEERSLMDKGATHTGMEVEVDGNIVTANGPAVAKEFAEKLAFLLEV